MDETPSLPRGLSSPARAALTEAGYRTLADLQGRKVSQLLALHGVGPKTIPTLAAALAEQGLAPLEAGD